jgi:hypothetical protein
VRAGEYAKADDARLRPEAIEERTGHVRKR